MSKKTTIQNMSRDEFVAIANTCKTKTELLSKLGVPVNGTYIRLINNKLEECEITINYKQPIKYPVVTKICPACGKPFKVKQGSPKEATTCSYACANSHFRSGPDHPNWKLGGNEKPIRSTCFHYHKKECIICGESNIVAVHHYDHDRTNNDPSNLIPMCPTHHQYHHSNFRDMVDSQINTYRDAWIKENVSC